MDFSVIIPHRNSADYLRKLIDSIPSISTIEVIVVDNSPTPIKKEDVNAAREFFLLYSAPQRGAGGARNEGIKVAKGKWLLFADADDFFLPNAFDIFYSKINSDADIVYTMAESIFADTGDPATRADIYNDLVRDYLASRTAESKIRIDFNVPWAKMIKREYVVSGNYLYDEVRASNDIFFGVTTGINALKIEALDKPTYVVTVNRGSLTQTKTLEVLQSRYLVTLRTNQYLKQRNLGMYQYTIAKYIVLSKSFGLKVLVSFVRLALSYRQNLFIGCTRWAGAYFRMKKQDKSESKYRISHD